MVISHGFCIDYFRIVLHFQTDHGISDHDTAVYIDSDISIKRQRPTQRKIMLWNKTDLDGLKKEVTFLTHIPTPPISTPCGTT